MSAAAAIRNVVTSSSSTFRPAHKRFGAPSLGKSHAMPMREEHRRLTETAKRAAGILKDAGVPFLLAGGLASWARGGPQTDHDVDFFVKPEDATRAQQALEAAGLRADRPPEDWLHKVWDGD